VFYNVIPLKITLNLLKDKKIDAFILISLYFLSVFGHLINVCLNQNKLRIKNYVDNIYFQVQSIPSMVRYL